MRALRLGTTKDIPHRSFLAALAAPTLRQCAAPALMAPAEVMTQML